MLFILWPWLFLAAMQTCQVQLWVPLRSIHFYQEVASTPPSEILSTLQLTPCEHLFFSPRHHRQASSFVKRSHRTQNLSVLLMTLPWLILIHTPVIVQSCDNTVWLNVSDNREFTCTCLHTVPPYLTIIVILTLQRQREWKKTIAKQGVL